MSAQRLMAHPPRGSIVFAARLLLALLACGTALSQEAGSESGHIAPDPPQHVLPAMSDAQMTHMMSMDDRSAVGKLMLDRFELFDGGAGTSTSWDAQAWYGSDYSKLWFKTEGERPAGGDADARVELLWNRIATRWWSLQAGFREDVGAGSPRTWIAIGIEGLAPGWFETEVTGYVGETGRTALRAEAHRDVLFTQKLVLQPRAETRLYGRADPERLIGSGISDLQIGVRLRYEIRREFAPYVGIQWRRQFGASARYAIANGDDPDELQVLAGLRAWF